MEFTIVGKKMGRSRITGKGRHAVLAVRTTKSFAASHDLQRRRQFVEVVQSTVFPDTATLWKTGNGEGKSK